MMIQVQDLNKTIHDKPILKDINVEIRKGRLTSLIGPNGAGKSTLLSAVSRLMDIDTGSIELEYEGIGAFTSNEIAKKLSVLKQTNHTELNITVEQLVAFGRFPYSKGRLDDTDKEKINEALDLLQLQEIRDRNLKTLSGGQRQRAYIAMTIAQDTECILLDEPLNNLDMKYSVEIMKTLRKLTREHGKTIVIVLHDINFASSYSDDVIAMKDGEIVKASERDEVIQPSILRHLYDMDVDIECIRGQRICLYYS